MAGRLSSLRRSQLVGKGSTAMYAKQMKSCNAWLAGTLDALGHVQQHAEQVAGVVIALKVQRKHTAARLHARDSLSGWLLVSSLPAYQQVLCQSQLTALPCPAHLAHCIQDGHVALKGGRARVLQLPEHPEQQAEDVLC